MDSSQIWHLAPSRHRKRLLQLDISWSFGEISTFHFLNPENRCFPKGGARLGRTHGPEAISTHATAWCMAIPGRWMFISWCKHIMYFFSYIPVNAISNCMYPIKHSQFLGKMVWGTPWGT